MSSPNSAEQSPISLKTLHIEQPETGLEDLDFQELNNYLGALFSLREKLIIAWENSPQELAAFDSILSNALMIAIDRRDLGTVLAEAQRFGWVHNGADVWPLIEWDMRSFFENSKPPDKERLRTIPIIGVTGKIASGKGTLAKIISEKYDSLTAPISHILKALALVVGYRPPFSREQLREIKELYNPYFGNQIFVELIFKQVQRMVHSTITPEVIVLEGFRIDEQAEYFLAQPNTHLVAVIASEDAQKDQEIRFKRQLKRARGIEDSPTLAGFQKDDDVEGAWIDKVIEIAKTRGRVIVNNGDEEAFRENIFSVLKDLLPKVSE